jgi:hypothetical protein
MINVQPLGHTLRRPISDDVARTPPGGISGYIRIPVHRYPDSPHGPRFGIRIQFSGTDSSLVHDPANMTGILNLDRIIQGRMVASNFVDGTARRRGWY